jgi:hypothetical protein
VSELQKKKITQKFKEKKFTAQEKKKLIFCLVERCERTQIFSVHFSPFNHITIVNHHHHVRGKVAESWVFFGAPSRIQ